MIVLEFKLAGASSQYAAFDEAIRTTQFIRNKGTTVENPRHLRRSERALKRVQRRPQRGTQHPGAGIEARGRNYGRARRK